jgi:hypothetical protein
VIDHHGEVIAVESPGTIMISRRKNARDEAGRITELTAAGHVVFAERPAS